MTLRPSELLPVAAEIAAVLAGRSVQKVVQPDERTIALGFAGGWLLVSVDRRRGRVHLLDEKPAGTGEAAPPFCMLLRKELVGLRLLDVEAVAGERALALGFGRDRAARRLVVFLYGGGARMVLVAEEGSAIATLPPSARADTTVALPPPREPRQDEPPPRFTAPSLSRQIEEHYSEAQRRETVEEARAQAAGAARRGIERLRRREEALAGDLRRIDAASIKRRDADLILAHLADVPRGASEVSLPDDFGGGGPVAIALDPARSATENAARLYHDFKRLTRGRAAVAKRLEATRAERLELEARLAAILGATEVQLGALVSRSGTARSPSTTARTVKREGARRPYRIFCSSSGAEIFVGKGAEKNDELTFHVARGNDLWLHTRDLPGAHVIVPLAGRPVDETTLIEAAMLAAWFSPARPSGPLEVASASGAQADITYAPRKFVRKPRNAAPGRVSVAGGKTFRVRLEPERLRRLLASRVDE